MAGGGATRVAPANSNVSWVRRGWSFSNGVNIFGRRDASASPIQTTPTYFRFDTCARDRRRRRRRRRGRPRRLFPLLPLSTLRNAFRRIPLPC